MAELLIRVTDKINKDDFYKNCQCTKRGDVIVVCPDGWLWGDRELDDPQYRIIKMPKMTVEEASVLLAPEPETDPKNPSRTLQRRLFKIDLDAGNITSEVAAYIDDATRAQAVMVADDTADAVAAKVAAETEKYAALEKEVEVAGAVLTKDDFLALVITKEPIPDPAVIGDPIGVL